MNPSAAEARAKRIPLWRWALWWSLLGVSGVLFYFLLAPFWLGLRGLAWIAEFRSRRGKD